MLCVRKVDGETYEYLKPDPGHLPEEVKSWTYGASELGPPVHALESRRMRKFQGYAKSSKLSPITALRSMSTGPSSCCTSVVKSHAL